MEKKCRYCGTVLEGFELFCPGCGHTLKKRPDRPEPSHAAHPAPVEARPIRAIDLIDLSAPDEPKPMSRAERRRAAEAARLMAETEAAKNTAATVRDIPEAPQTDIYKQETDEAFDVIEEPKPVSIRKSAKHPIKKDAEPADTFEDPKAVRTRRSAKPSQISSQWKEPEPVDVPEEPTSVRTRRSAKSSQWDNPEPVDVPEEPTPVHTRRSAKPSQWDNPEPVDVPEEPSPVRTRRSEKPSQISSQWKEPDPVDVPEEPLPSRSQRRHRAEMVDPVDLDSTWKKPVRRKHYDPSEDKTTPSFSGKHRASDADSEDPFSFEFSFDGPDTEEPDPITVAIEPFDDRPASRKTKMPKRRSASRNDPDDEMPPTTSRRASRTRSETEADLESIETGRRSRRKHDPSEEIYSRKTRKRHQPEPDPWADDEPRLRNKRRTGTREYDDRDSVNGSSTALIILGVAAIILLMLIGVKLIRSAFFTGTPNYAFNDVMGRYFDAVLTANPDEFIDTRPVEYIDYLTEDKNSPYADRETYRKSINESLITRLAGYTTSYGEVRAIRYQLTSVKFYTQRVQQLTQVLAGWYGFDHTTVTDAVLVSGIYTVQGTDASGSYAFADMLLIEIEGRWYFAPDAGTFWKGD